MNFPPWTKSSFGKWFFTLLIAPLFWWMMAVVIGGGMTLIIWLLAMAFYIPLLLFVGGKIKPGNPTLPAHTEKLRLLAVWLGRIEFGMFLYMFYFLIYMIIIMIIFHDDFL